jgi:hypothetical protein
MSFEISKTIRNLVDIDLKSDFSNALLDATRLRSLSEADIAELLERDEVQFIVRDRQELRHIAPERTADFWLSNVRGNVVSPDRLYVASASFISGFYYRASEWLNSVDQPIVLLELTR